MGIHKKPSSSGLPRSIPSTQGSCKLKAYVADQEKAGKNPIQVAAAIKAHVTRRTAKS